MTVHREHRCDWVGSDPLYRTYHDREWGVPVHDDRLLFEFLILVDAIPLSRSHTSAIKDR